jgi:hypothetical protein
MPTTAPSDTVPLHLATCDQFIEELSRRHTLGLINSYIFVHEVPDPMTDDPSAPACIRVSYSELFTAVGLSQYLSLYLDQHLDDCLPPPTGRDPP